MKSTGHGFRRDAAAAISLVLIILFFALSSIDSSCYWGDDYAAYISEGIAIAEGRLDEQAKLNALMHPSPLPQEAGEGELVYVWGYPLLLSLVYKFSGFDRLGFEDIVYFKLPSVAALALLGAVLYLFFRRRFGGRLSFVMALAICCCGEFFDFLNTLYSDMVFLFFAMLSILLCELFLNSEKGRRKTALALFFGLSLWYMYEVRLNGTSIVICCVLAHIFFLFRQRDRLRETKLSSQLLPYAVFAVAVLISQALLAKATSNNSDLGSGLDLMLFAGNVKSYLRLIGHWFGLLWNSILINPAYSILRRFAAVEFSSFTGLREALVVLSYGFTVLGLVLRGRRENLHLSLLVVLYVLIASILPYTQGLRYIYPLLPFILMYAVYGAVCCFERLPRPKARLRNVMGLLLSAYCCLFILYPHISAFIEGDRGVNELEVISSPSDVYMQNAYSPAAVEAYRFIIENTDENGVFAFFAPRALHLNTQRVCLRPGVNGHSLEDADYYLRYLKVGDFPIDEEPGENFTLLFSNSEFVLYEKNGR